ncbi:hypothetical protein Mapa_001043 [Marchantia paleacea]|nr:hypothetical protein Mapa_001043 [Marchantia paleacea]
MAKLEAVTTLLALAVVILPLTAVEPAQAVDYLFWDGPSCSGLVQTRCTAVSNITCCVSDTAYQSVEVRAESCQYTTAFKNGDCATNFTVLSKNGSRCFHSRGAPFTATRWESRCTDQDIPEFVGAPLPAVKETTDDGTIDVTVPAARSSRALLGDRRSETAAPGAGECARHLEVDDHVIVFREGPVTGIWSLGLEGVTRAELLEELASVPEDEKVFWLFVHGATYENQAVGLIFDIVDA